MYILLFVCTHIHVHTHTLYSCTHCTHMYTHMHMYTHTHYKHIFETGQMLRYIFICIYVYVCMYIYTHIHVHTRIIYICIYICTYTHICIYKYTYIYIYIHTYIYIYTYIFETGRMLRSWSMSARDTLPGAKGGRGLQYATATRTCSSSMILPCTSAGGKRVS